MKLEMRGQMRLEQKMKLAPHMIQSMEILQLPILALQERIEQELNSNPVLECEEQATQQEPTPADDVETDSSRDAEVTEDFSKVNELDDHYSDYVDQRDNNYRKNVNEEKDAKLEALKNTVARPKSLCDHLTEQWRLVDCSEGVAKAGERIIEYLDGRGYLTVRLEQLHMRDDEEFSFEDMETALSLVQGLEPLGVGSRDTAECLVIQMKQAGDDYDFEIKLISQYMQRLMENRLPEIAAKMRCSVEQINDAIKRVSKFDISPGLSVSSSLNHAIAADVSVEWEQNTEEYIVKLADWNIPSLRINRFYEKMSRDNGAGEQARKYLSNNIRSAQWIIDAINQRKETLLKVTRSIVERQRGFFDKGQLYLKPLPMSDVAGDVGVHLATVSRAVAGKYVQCSWGVLPLRNFFSGGMTDEDGNAHSWQAIRVKLSEIVDNEDKTKPLSDEKIRERLAQMGITGLARRTVAKYRKLLNIPPARLRRKY
jgi:RNA polymerase sigma-54 factor